MQHCRIFLLRLWRGWNICITSTTSQQLWGILKISCKCFCVVLILSDFSIAFLVSFSCCFILTKFFCCARGRKRGALTACIGEHAPLSYNWSIYLPLEVLIVSDRKHWRKATMYCAHSFLVVVFMLYSVCFNSGTFSWPIICFSNKFNRNFNLWIK